MGFLANIKQKFLSAIDNRGGWWPMVREPHAGAWQKNEEWLVDDVAAHHAVYACITLISSDIGKLPFKILKEDADGILVPATYKNVKKLLKKPNNYQNHIQFKQWWLASKLFRGNTYALKYRGQNNEVERLYILDPDLVTVLVADDGSVFYQLSSDRLSTLNMASITVPASEIIHDRNCPMFHPLVGVSPLFASGLAANQGIKIQNDSSRFFSNGARPGGVLTAPGAISNDTAERVKNHWDTNFGGVNSGKVAVLGDGLKFEPLRMTSSDAQLMEQLRWTAEVVCTTFHVPGYKVGVGALPSKDNAETLNTEYYTQCLQILMEEMESCLNEGLSLPDNFTVQLDLDVLFRMDSSALVRMLSEGVKGGIYKPNEARKKVNLSPVEGGDTIYLQQQYYSLEALSRRDAKPDPFSTSAQAPSAAQDPAVKTVSDNVQELELQARTFAQLLEKEVALVITA